jgi:hypothetical protein
MTLNAYAKCQKRLVSFILSVMNKSIMLNVIMLSVIILNVGLLSVIMLNVAAR